MAKMYTKVKGPIAAFYPLGAPRDSEDSVGAADPVVLPAQRPRREGPICVECGKEPQEDSGGRCEDCWAVAATRWIWFGINYNALKHGRRRK